MIVPTGGTEKNGYHMVLGKHNYVVTYAANLMARRLKNALVAPTIQYVPEGDPDTSVPGEISLPSPAYDMLLDAAARSLKVHGFTDILFIGDSGGNQAGMTNVADKLNEEWKGTGVEGVRADRLLQREPGALSRVAAGGVRLRRGDGRQPRRHHRHVADAVRPAGRHPQGSDQAVGRAAGLGRVRRSDEGDAPRSARWAIEFKVNAGLNQYKLLKNPPPQRGGRGGGRCNPLTYAVTGDPGVKENC